MISRPFAYLLCCAWIQGAGPARAAPGEDILPRALERVGPAKAQKGRGWTTEDIVEIARITGVAVRGNERVAAFLVKQPSIRLGTDRYGLYLVDATETKPARKILESAFLADLQWRPGTSSWTVQGDFGEGVQLYEIDDAGRASPLVAVPELALVGGANGVIHSATERPRRTGVVAYGWAPDGSTLWYSRLRLRSAEERQALLDNGIVYDDVTTSSTDFEGEPAAKAIELRILETRSGSDTLVASAPGDRMTTSFAFQRGSVEWGGSDRLTYRLVRVTEDGRRDADIWSYDLRARQAREEPSTGFVDALRMTATPKGMLTIRPGSGGRPHLIEISRDGKTTDHGPASFSSVRQAWYDAEGRAVLSVRHPDRHGLSIFPPSPGAKALEGIRAHLQSCAFSADLSFGACSREDLTHAPELVTVFPQEGRVALLARPNARYDTIQQLRIEPTQWTNRFGTVDTGYVTYPRGYQPGRKYPAIVITHAIDAQNRFAWDGFQWSYPVQLFAERGYFVLSVNESHPDREVLNAYSTGRSNLPAKRMQQGMGLEAVATMEAAAKSLIDKGMVDADRVGIAGYSRGAIVTTLTMSQSKLFKAGSNADTHFFNAGGFWSGAMVRELYRGLFGGSPWDPRYFENYRAFSPSARAEHFSGPLLQMHTAAVAPDTIELDQMLKEAGVPTEMVVYPDETHLLHRPRTIASAMAHSFDWFDYWLMDRRDPNPAKAGQYRRWDAQAKRWQEAADANAKHTRLKPSITSSVGEQAAASTLGFRR